jgi:hypothetical protein
LVDQSFDGFPLIVFPYLQLLTMRDFASASPDSQRIFDSFLNDTKLGISLGDAGDNVSVLVQIASEQMINFSCLYTISLFTRHYNHTTEHDLTYSTSYIVYHTADRDVYCYVIRNTNGLLFFGHTETVVSGCIY